MSKTIRIKTIFLSPLEEFRLVGCWTEGLCWKPISSITTNFLEYTTPCQNNLVVDLCIVVIRYYVGEFLMEKTIGS